MPRSWLARLGLITLATTLVSCAPAHQDDVTPSTYVDPPMVTANAFELYGDRAGQAYHQAAAHLLEHSFVVPLIDPQHPTPTEIELTEGVVDVMTPDAATAWRDLVRADLAGDDTARDAVRLLRFHTWEVDDADLSANPVRFQSITEGEVGLAAPSSSGDVQPLVVALVHRAGIELVRGKVRYEVRVTKHLTFTMVPSGGAAPDRWQIETFEGILSTEVDGEDLEPSGDGASPITESRTNAP